MKTRILVFALAMLALSGCGTLTSKKLASDLAEFEKLGLTEIVITGKFSHTDYTVTKENGKRKAVINHTNAWVPQIKVVRETEEAKPNLDQ